MKNRYGQLKNIKILTHNSMIPQGAKIMSKDGTDRIRDVYFENITVNENMCDWDSLGVEIDDGINGIYYNKCMVK